MHSGFRDEKRRVSSGQWLLAYLFDSWQTTRSLSKYLFSSPWTTQTELRGRLTSPGFDFRRVLRFPPIVRAHAKNVVDVCGPVSVASEEDTSNHPLCPIKKNPCSIILQGRGEGRRLESYSSLCSIIWSSSRHLLRQHDDDRGFVPYRVDKIHL